jgi:hypothetical protein
LICYSFEYPAINATAANNSSRQSSLFHPLRLLLFDVKNLQAGPHQDFFLRRESSSFSWAVRRLSRRILGIIRKRASGRLGW